MVVFINKLFFKMWKTVIFINIVFVVKLLKIIDFVISVTCRNMTSMLRKANLNVSNAALYSPLLPSTLQPSTAISSSLQPSTALYSHVQPSALYSPLLPSTALYCPLQPSTALYCHLQLSTTLYSAVR